MSDVVKAKDKIDGWKLFGAWTLYSISKLIWPEQDLPGVLSMMGAEMSSVAEASMPGWWLTILDWAIAVGGGHKIVKWLNALFKVKK